MSDAFPEIGPLLRAARADAIDIRPVLARVLTDLFVARQLHMPTALTQFAALVEPLARTIDTEVAVVIARKLAPHRETPAAVTAALLAREDEASCATLRHAASLDPATLERLAETGPRALAAAIAGRPDLAPALARLLVARGDPTIDAALAAAHVRPLPADVLAELARRARGGGETAALLLARGDVAFSLRCSLFLAATPVARAEIAIEATRRAFLARPRSNPLLRSDADEALSITAARECALDKTLCDWLGLPAEEAAMLASDASGEPVALALRACGATPDRIVAVLINAGRPYSQSVARIFALDRLLRETSAEGAALVLHAIARIAPAGARRRPPASVADRAFGRPQLQERATQMPVSASRRDHAR